MSVALQKIEAMNQSYDTTKPEDKSQVIKEVQPSQQSFSSRLKAVSITFPDGVNLKHLESGVAEMIALLDSYRSSHKAEGGATPCYR